MKQSVRLEKESVLDAMREMYASGIIPTRVNWNAKRPSGQPIDRTINKMFGECEWSNVVAMAFDVKIKCKASWVLATEDRQKALVIELIRGIAIQIGRRPGIADWNDERPPYVPRAQNVGKLFGGTWNGLTTKLVCDDIGLLKELAESRRLVGPRGLEVTGMKLKRIWIGDCRYRDVIAGVCK